MKRNFILLLTAFAFLVAAQSVQAQSSTPVILGVKGGLNLGNASLSLPPDFPTEYSKSNRSGILAGGFAEFGIAEGLFVTGEVLYAQMGVEVSAPILVTTPFGPEPVSGTLNVKEKADYIHVPISLKYKFPIPESIVRPYIFVGPSISFNVSSKTLQEYSGQVVQYLPLAGIPTSTEEDTKDSTKSVDVAGHLGAGVEFEVSSNVLLFVDGRYSMSFTNASKVTDVDFKGRNIMVMGGVAFKLP
jgi:opacity protein-like surface antigen